MSNPKLTQMQAVLKSSSKHNNKLSTMQLFLFDEDLEPLAVAGVAASQEDSEAESVSELVTDFNALLAKLRASGAMASS